MMNVELYTHIQQLRKKETSSGKRLMVPVIGRMTHAERLIPPTSIPKATDQTEVFLFARPDHDPCVHTTKLCL